jgi:hypothetical protein
MAMPAIGEPLRGGGIGDRIGHQHEFVPAEAGHGIGGAHHRGQAPRDLLQQFIACPVPQRVVDQLEAVEIAGQHRERSAIALRTRDGLRQAVVQQDPVRQSREGIMHREMAQLPVGRFQPVGPIGDVRLEATHLLLDPAIVLPLAAQCRGTLQHFDRLGGLAQHQQSVRVAEPPHHLGPVVVGVCGTDHHLHVRVHRPKLLDGLQPVPPRWHAHVDERQCIGTAVGDRAGGHRDAFLALIRGIDLETRPD